MYPDETVKFMPMQLSAVTDIAKRILHTYYSTLHELKSKIPDQFLHQFQLMNQKLWRIMIGEPQMISSS